jgi:hypothetical protein
MTLIEYNFARVTENCAFLLGTVSTIIVMTGNTQSVSHRSQLTELPCSGSGPSHACGTASAPDGPLCPLQAVQHSGL